MPLPPLTPHPRLAASRAQLRSLRQTPTLPLLRRARRHLLQLAHHYAATTRFPWPQDTHNAHLVRARINQTRVLTLLAAWFATEKPRFKIAALEHLAEMERWPCWSWIAWRKKDFRPDAIFDLSYGENAMTLALAYDWLADALTPAQKSLILRLAQNRVFLPFLKNAPNSWWFRNPNSNWNTVCTGGAGMLALALRDQLPHAQKVLALAEKSFPPYMHNLSATAGGWPEGIGYWNYGMRYAFWYLLSHERATGKNHPLLQPRAVQQTLAFPLDFSPNSVPCSFNDINQWQPLPFHYAAAQRLRRPDILAQLERRLEKIPHAVANKVWPDTAELLLFHTGQKTAAPPPRRPIAKLYPGIDWAILADQLPDPRLYLSLRGGSAAVPHAHLDLLSFHLVLKNQPMIGGSSAFEYLDTTFSPRRNEIYDISPHSKNTLLINGVGITANSAVTTTPLILSPRITGFRLDATAAMGPSSNGPAALFCARAFLMLDNHSFLIIDSLRLPHVGRVEARFHTSVAAALFPARAQLSAKNARLHLHFACNVPAHLHRALACPTTPQPRPDTVLRWCADHLHEQIIMATLLSPTRAALRLHCSAKTIAIQVTSPSRSLRLRLTPTLTL